MLESSVEDSAWESEHRARQRGSSRSVRHEQCIGHTLLEVPDHHRLDPRDRQRLDWGCSELDNLGPVGLWALDHNPVFTDSGYGRRPCFCLENTADIDARLVVLIAGERGVTLAALIGAIDGFALGCPKFNDIGAVSLRAVDDYPVLVGYRRFFCPILPRLRASRPAHPSFI